MARRPWPGPLSRTIVPVCAIPIAAAVSTPSLCSSGTESGTEDRKRKRDRSDKSESGTGPILKLGGPADVRAIFTRARHFDFGPPFAGDPWDDRPTLGPNVARFPSAIPAGQKGGLVAHSDEALPVPARRRFDRPARANSLAYRSATPPTTTALLP